MSREIKHLSPFMQKKAFELLSACKQEGIDAILVCTHRSLHEQQECFDSGASNARPGESAHNATDEAGNPASEAFDIGVIRHGKYIGDGSDPAYRQAGEIGEKLGLSWSGRWKGKLREVGHFQNPNWAKPKRKEG